MSKIGRQPVEIKEGVTVTLNQNEVKVEGPKGSLSYRFPLGIEAKQEDGKVVISKKNDAVDPALYGVVRATIANMVQGVTSGFQKQLELSGVGYRASTSGNELVLSVGFSHPVKIKAEEGISFSVAENVITVSGVDTSLVGNTAARIREVRPPEPYKGKGISYKGERIRRKAGKAAKAVGAK